MFLLILLACLLARLRGRERWPLQRRGACGRWAGARLVAARPILAGEEGCLNYGAKGNRELLLSYGFAEAADGGTDHHSDDEASPRALRNLMTARYLS